MKISVGVHNNVRADARVLKEARTLTAAGHQVRIYGLTTVEGGESFVIDSNIPVVLTFRTKHQRIYADTPLRQASLARAEQAGSDARMLKRVEDVQASFAHQGDLVRRAIQDDSKPDAIHIHDHVILTAAAAMKSECGVPIIWDAHEIYEALAGLEDARQYVNPAIIDVNQRYIDRFVTISENIAGFYRDRYPLIPSGYVLPNASNYQPGQSYDGRLHAAAGLPPSQKILLFQGGFADHRGVLKLAEAAALLKPDWSVVFMGWGPLKDGIDAIASSVNGDSSLSAKRIAVIPGAPHDELAEWTSGASLGAITYENTGLNHYYCTPNKLWEYPLAGVPILATDLLELGGAVRTYGIGLVLPEQFDHRTIAAAVNEVDADRLAKLKHACAHYSSVSNWEVYEHRLVACYASLHSNLD